MIKRTNLFFEKLIYYYRTRSSIETIEVRSGIEVNIIIYEIFLILISAIKEVTKYEIFDKIPNDFTIAPNILKDISEERYSNESILVVKMQMIK